MKIQHIEVRNHFLKKYIDYYYLLSTVGDSESTTYLAFPSCNSPVAFFKNAEFLRLSRSFKICPSPRESLEVLLVGNFLQPIQITFEPNILEFSIVFKPLGINVFVGRSLGSEMLQDILQFDEFEELVPLVQKIIEGEDRLDELERTLRSRFSPNSQLEILDSAIEKFKDAENQLTVQQIAEELNISSRSLFRLFKNNLGINPTQCRQLLRLRNALTLSLNNLEGLPKADMLAGYYDQSHFIKEFKKIFNLTPRHFFSKISLEANERIAWQVFSKTSDSYNT